MDLRGRHLRDDVTARGIRRQEKQYTRAKGFATFAPVGPCIAVGLETADLLAYISSIMTLLTGDIIFAGTPAGIGAMAAGDMVTVTASGVGELANPVVQMDRVSGPGPWSPARSRT